jgi:transposase-like protein
MNRKADSAEHEMLTKKRGCTRAKLGRQENFLKLLSEFPEIKLVAHEMGISREIVYQWRKDQEFAARMDEAIDIATEGLLSIAWERASKGKSDDLLKWLVNKWRPEYRENQKIEIKKNPKVIAMSRAFAQVLKKYVPQEFVQSALNEWLSLSGGIGDTGTGASGDGPARRQLPSVNTSEL